jgi:hypothetical protein
MTRLLIFTETSVARGVVRNGRHASGLAFHGLPKLFRAAEEPEIVALEE